MNSDHTLRRAVITGPKQIKIEETPFRSLAPNEVLVKIQACAICTWEKRAFTGADSRFYPLLGGHEIAGVVEEIGTEAGAGLAQGDRVAVSGLTRCGKCDSCRRGLNNRCDNTWQSNHKPGEPIGPAGLSTYILAKDYQIFKLHPDTDFVAGSLSEPVACVLRSIKKAQVEAGDFVVIMGGGVMGILHLLLAKRRGATVLLSEPNKERRRRATELGADYILDPSEAGLVDTVKSLTNGHGARVIFDAVGSGPALESAIQAVAKGGHLHVYARVYPKGATITIDPNLFHEKEIVLTGTMSQSSEDFLQAAEMISQRAIDMQPIISATYPLDQIYDAFEASIDMANYRVVVTM
jgi:threonine dehydrogenase-like Zn-dependent dehydrogenase